MERAVEGEWLDALPPNDPSAIASRRDLEKLNRLMGNAGLMRALLESRSRKEPPQRIVELGAGDGRFSLQLAKRLSTRWKPVEIVLVDCKDAVSEQTCAEFAALGWSAERVVADVFEWLEKTESGLADIILANLFLHQFEWRDLTRLIALSAQRTRCFAATEPRRAGVPFWMSRMVGLIGCNAVTQHDAPLSVKAGFTGNELSGLWAKGKWQLRERGANLFTHTFLAERTGS